MVAGIPDKDRDPLREQRAARYHDVDTPITTNTAIGSNTFLRFNSVKSTSNARVPE